MNEQRLSPSGIASVPVNGIKRIMVKIPNLQYRVDHCQSSNSRQYLCRDMHVRLQCHIVVSLERNSQATKCAIFEFRFIINDWGIGHNKWGVFNFVDFKKAFDCVRPPLMYQILKTHLFIREGYIFQAFLNHHTCCI